MPVAHAQRVERLGVHLGDEMRDLAREIVSSLISRRTSLISRRASLISPISVRTPLSISVCTSF